jgi:hypothetical protein
MARKKYLVEMDEEDMQALLTLLKRASNFSIQEVKQQTEAWPLESIFLKSPVIHFGDPNFIRALADNGYAASSRSMLLARLVREGKIVRTGRGAYALNRH